jgi:predicted nucleic acid-binding Zn ribbon protein
MYGHRGEPYRGAGAGIVLIPMPTYVYKFVKTGETIEVQQSFTDETLRTVIHPRSGRKMAVKKVFTPVGVTFRGDGFYKTDSRSTSAKKATANSEKPDSSAGDTSPTTSSDSSKSSASASSEGSTGTSKDSDAKAAAAP